MADMEVVLSYPDGDEKWGTLHDDGTITVIDCVTPEVKEYPRRGDGVSVPEGPVGAPQEAWRTGWRAKGGSQGGGK